MNTRATADSSFDCYANSNMKGIDSAPRHLLDGTTPPAVRRSQHPHYEHHHHPPPPPHHHHHHHLGGHCLAGPAVPEVCGAGGAHRVGAQFSSSSRHFVKPNRDSNWGQRGIVGTHVHRDPCAIDSVNSGRVTPPPPVQVDGTHELGSDLVVSRAGATATVTGIGTGTGTGMGMGMGMTTGVDSATAVGTASGEGKTLEAKTGNAVPPPPCRPPAVFSAPCEASTALSRGKHVADDAFKTSGNDKAVSDAPRKEEGEREQCNQQRQEQHGDTGVVDSGKAENSGAGSQGCAAVSSTATSTAGLANCTRPVVVLSVHLVAFYKRVNELHSRQRRLEAPGPKYNNGFDDKDGHYLVLSGEEILNRYTVQEVLGKGSFGTVLRCFDEKRRENVALKITRHGISFRTQAKLELDILMKLNMNQHLNHLVVKLLKVFDWQGHLVLVFELLSYNLYQLIKCTRYNGITLDLVRKFAYQLVQVLYQLDQAKPSPVIHCDIKPENILLKNQNRSGIRLIDFGSACYMNKVVHKYIQSRYYRSPEVILYLEYGTAIDRWSLGCVLVELHTGTPLFDGRTEAAQLARFEAMLGPLPLDMLEASPKTPKFYEKTATGYKLKESPSPTRSLEIVLGVTTGGPRGLRKGQAGHSEEAYRQFHDFLSRLLCYRPSERMSCHDAMRHPFLEPLWGSDPQQQPQQPPPPPPSPPPRKEEAVTKEAKRK